MLPKEQTFPIAQPAEGRVSCHSSSPSIDVTISDKDRDCSTDSSQNDPIQPTKQQIKRALNLSLCANVLLLTLKIVAFYNSSSSAILASMIDSMVDLVSKVIMFLVERYKEKKTDKYPVGKRRLEPIAVLVISIFMMVSSILVIYNSALSLYETFFDTKARDAVQFMEQHFGSDNAQVQALKHHFPDEPVRTFAQNAMALAMMGVVIICKFGLWMYCRRYNESSIVNTLSEDHFNDVAANLIAVAAFMIAAYDHNWAYIDQIGAILVGAYIIFGWTKLAMAEIKELVGKAADAEELKEIKKTCMEYRRAHKYYKMKVDKVTAYHNGSYIIAEVDIILPKQTPLAMAHDISLGLQHELERIAWIERAYVHADDIPEPQHETAHIK